MEKAKTYFKRNWILYAMIVPGILSIPGDSEPPFR